MLGSKFCSFAFAVGVGSAVDDAEGIEVCARLVGHGEQPALPGSYAICVSMADKFESSRLFKSWPISLVRVEMVESQTALSAEELWTISLGDEVSRIFWHKNMMLKICVFRTAHPW